MSLRIVFLNLGNFCHRISSVSKLYLYWYSQKDKTYFFKFITSYFIYYEYGINNVQTRWNKTTYWIKNAHNADIYLFKRYVFNYNVFVKILFIKESEILHYIIAISTPVYPCYDFVIISSFHQKCLLALILDILCLLQSVSVSFIEFYR